MIWGGGGGGRCLARTLERGCALPAGTLASARQTASLPCNQFLQFQPPVATTKSCAKAFPAPENPLLSLSPSFSHSCFFLFYFILFLLLGSVGLFSHTDDEQLSEKYLAKCQPAAT